MKVNTINTAYYMPVYARSSEKSKKLATTPDTEEVLTPMPDNYGRALVFKSHENTIKNIIQNIPFEEKLAFGLKELYEGPFIGNVLLVAKDKKELPKLMEYLQIPIAIQKLNILTVPEIDTSMFFTRNGRSITMVNTSEVPFISSMLDYIEGGDTFDIQLGDHICTPNGWFTIKLPEEDSAIEQFSSMFLQTIDYTDKLEEIILKHNKSVQTNVEELASPKPKHKALTFESVGGQDEALEAIRRNILFPLKYPDIYDGFMISRGAVLYGPPGTGKTLIAKALANESNASFFELCATDLANKYVGESEKNCRDLFEKAVDAQPSIIYFDEIDALGKARGNDVYGDKLLTQLLSLISDLEYRGDNVFVIGSTNRKEDLDSAFIRSGRFSTLLEIKAPDLKGTKQILEIHTNGKPIDQDVDMDDIAKKMFTKKMTGADIALTIKEAFSHALERTGIYESMAKNKYSPMMKDFLTINTEDFIFAIDKFKNGSDKRASVGFNK